MSGDASAWEERLGCLVCEADRLVHEMEQAEFGCNTAAEMGRLLARDMLREARQPLLRAQATALLVAEILDVQADNELGA